MSLRTRLLAGILALLAVFMVGAVVTVVVQRGHLRDQIDEQLLATPPPNAGRVTAEQRDAPISDLYFARVEDDQSLTVLVEGLLLTDTPNTTQFRAALPDQPTLVTLAGEQGTSEFRVLYIPPATNRASQLIAVPLDDVNATVRQLIYTLAIVAALLACVAALLASWVNRFGLKPISEMTAVADAIGAGDTTSRAASYNSATEAGRLSNALNQMLDERDQAEATLRSFVSNASHELRTPLTSIRGYLDLYEQGAFREQVQLDDVVRRMQNESARMNLLVEDLLLLAKLDEQQPLDITSVDVALLLNDVAASAQASHPDRSIQVKAGTTTNSPIAADPLRLQQAVATLVDNALTHTTSEVTLAATTSDRSTQLTVSDQGPGLPPEVAEHVFDRFFRGDGSRSRDSGGSGLGLAIAKAIAEAHDGTISLDTSLDQGSTFTIEVPTQR